MKRIGLGIALVAALAAMLVPAAQARYVVNGGGSTQLVDPWFQNLLARQNAASVDKPAASFYTPAALNAMALNYQAQYQYYVTHGPGTTPDDRVVGIRGTGPVPTSTVSEGTDWGKIGAGLGSGVFAVLLAAGCVVILRRSRRPLPA
jgi:hypothetical protein